MEKKLTELAVIHIGDGVKVHLDEETEVWAFLLWAVRAGSLKIVQLVIENGFVTPDVKNESHQSRLLVLAVRFQHFDIVKFLIENSFAVTSKDCLVYECNQHKSEEVLKYLIELGVKCHHDSGEHHMPCFSILDCHLDLWKYSLTCVTKTYAKLCFSETEFHSFVRAGQVEIVKKIVEKQASEERLDSQSRKLAVFIAVENGNEEILKILSSAGYPVNISFHDKITPLHIAATFEHSRIVEILLQAGAEVNSATKYNVTPLDFAAAAGSSSNVQFLLDAGAKFSNTDRFISTLDYALKRNGHTRHESCVTPSMLRNLLKITKILLNAGVCKERSTLYCGFSLQYAINLQVFEEDERNRKTGELRAEIVRCLLNSFNEETLRGSFDIIVNKKINVDLNTPELMSVILEYCDPKSKLMSYLHRDYWSNLQIVDQIEDADYLLNLINEKIVKFPNPEFDYNWTDILKMITSRLLLLPGDQQLEEKKLDFFERNGLLSWVNECQLQIEIMRKTKLSGASYVTFYDILVKPVEKVSGFLRDEKLLNRLVSSYEEFPAYSNFLQLRVESGKRRQTLKDMCVCGMFNIIKKNHRIQFSSEGIEEILKYFSVVDLRRFSAACNS